MLAENDQNCSKIRPVGFTNRVISTVPPDMIPDQAAVGFCSQAATWGVPLESSFPYPIDEGRVEWKKSYKRHLFGKNGVFCPKREDNSIQDTANKLYFVRDGRNCAGEKATSEQRLSASIQYGVSGATISTISSLNADTGQKHAQRGSGSNSRANAAAFPVWPSLSPSESSLQNHNNNSSNTIFETTDDRAYSQYGAHNPLMRGNVFQELELRDELHRPPSESARPSSNTTNNLPSIPIAPLDSYPGIGADKSLEYPQQPLSFHATNRSTRRREPPSIPPSTAIDHSPSADSYTPAYSQPRRRPSGRVISNAECMITRVEQLYEVGVDIGILPEDPALPSSLHKMKARFRLLTSDRYAYDDDLDDSATGGGLEDSSQDGGSY